MTRLRLAPILLVLVAVAFARPAHGHAEHESYLWMNIEADHLDYYRDLVEITAAFQAFATQVPPGVAAHPYRFAGVADPRASPVEQKAGRIATQRANLGPCWRCGRDGRLPVPGIGPHAGHAREEQQQ